MGFFLQKMEGGSEEAEKNKTTPEGGGGESKSKRKMKTAAQLEVLENTYAGLCLCFLIFLH